MTTITRSGGQVTINTRYSTITSLGLAGLATSAISGTLTLSKSGTTARTVTFPDAAITVAGSAAALTSGRIPFVTSGGLLTDEAAFAYDSSTNTLTVDAIKTSSSGGLLLQNSAGASVLLLGAGPSTGITAYGQINGTSVILSSGLTCTASVESAASIAVKSSNGRFTINNGTTSGGMRLTTTDAADTADGYLQFEGWISVYGRINADGTWWLGPTDIGGSDRLRVNGSGRFSGGITCTTITATGLTTITSATAVGTPGTTGVNMSNGQIYVGNTGAASIQAAGGVTCKGLTSTVSGIAATFDSGAASDARMEFKRNGVRQGLFTWDTATLRIEGDTAAGSGIYFRAGGSDRISVTSTGVVTVLSTSDGSLVCNGRITAKAAVPASFADLAAVRSYLISILT